jgi:hypothetical protein
MANFGSDLEAAAKRRKLEAAYQRKTALKNQPAQLKTKDAVTNKSANVSYKEQMKNHSLMAFTEEQNDTTI